MSKYPKASKQCGLKSIRLEAFNAHLKQFKENNNLKYFIAFDDRNIENTFIDDSLNSALLAQFDTFPVHSTFIVTRKHIESSYIKVLYTYENEAAGIEEAMIDYTLKILGSQIPSLKVIARLAERKWTIYINLSWARETFSNLDLLLKKMLTMGSIKATADKINEKIHVSENMYISGSNMYYDDLLIGKTRLPIGQMALKEFLKGGNPSQAVEIALESTIHPPLQ